MAPVIFDPSSVSIEDFFQEGRGYYFHGIPYQRGYGQRGVGIGSIFRSFLRFILPIAKSAGKEVGKEALTTSARILDNIAQGQDLKNAVGTELKAGAKRLFKSHYPQEGAGIKKKRKKKALPSIKYHKMKRGSNFGFF